MAACKNGSAMLFVSAKVSQLALLPQGKVEAERRAKAMLSKMDELGFGNCTNTRACEAECPKCISIWRYFDNLNPGHNGGGWVDTGGMRYIDRYSEQLWLTVFAKAPEMTMFDYRQMLNPLRSSYRAPWQEEGGTSFSYDDMMKPVNLNGKTVTPTTMARAAGFTMEQVDRTIGFLGNPIGIKSYKPYQSTGEEFLQNYFGMIGIPMDIVPEFPSDANRSE